MARLRKPPSPKWFSACCICRNLHPLMPPTPSLWPSPTRRKPAVTTSARQRNCDGTSWKFEIRTMITFLKGTLVDALPTQVTIDVQGVGYDVLIPLSSFEKLPQPSQAIK